MTGVCRPGYVWIAMEGDGEGSVSDQTERLFCSLQGVFIPHLWKGSHLPFLSLPGALDQSGCGWSNVVLAYLYLSNMADYSLVNAVYIQYFPSQPPARYAPPTA